jgi:phosphohistidine phosphatase
VSNQKNNKVTKKIIIVRHAKSSWTDFSLSDFQRPLDQRGLNDAPVMAEVLREAGHYPQKIVSSSAVRAKSTAAFFSKTFQIDVEEADSLYHGLPNDYLDQIKQLSEDVQCVAFFGHNPGITFIANDIQSGITDNIPTCGIIVAEMPLDVAWQKTTWSKMKLKHILTPKDPYP